MKSLVKHITSIIFCIIFFSNVSAQFNPVIAYTPATQVIYIGVDNPIAVTLGEYNLSDVNIKVSEGTIKPDSILGKFLWRICSSKSDSVFLRFYHKDSLLQKIKYPLLPVLDVDVMLSGDSHSCFGLVNPIGNSVGLRTLNQYDVFDELNVPTKVASFCIQFLDTTYTPYRILYNKGAYFTKAVKEELDLLKAKQAIYIYNIKVQIGCEEKPRMMTRPIIRIVNN